MAIGEMSKLPREYEIVRIINLEHQLRCRVAITSRWEAHVNPIKDEVWGLITRPKHSKKALFRLLRQWEEAVNFHVEFN